MWSKGNIFFQQVKGAAIAPLLDPPPEPVRASVTGWLCMLHQSRPSASRSISRI